MRTSVLMRNPAICDDVKPTTGRYIAGNM